MKKIIAAIMSTMLMLNVLHAAEIKTIRFAAEATYPPFEFIDESGKMKGFDIDIANALCQAIKAECTFSNQSFNSLIPSLKIGKFDAVISALGITKEREKQVAFTQSYYEPSGSFVALTAKHYALKDMEGKTIGAQQSSTFEKYLQDKYGDKVKIKSYASIQDAFLDLISARVEVVLADTPIAQVWLKQNSAKYSIVEKPILDREYFGTGYGIAVKQDNVDLLKALNAALAAIKANGTYDKITKEYFGK